MNNKIKVLVVDDSQTVRTIIQRELARDPQIEIVGTARDPYDARDKIVQLKPDVLTLDIEMPRMDGITFLKKLMKYFPIPVIMVSSLTPAGGHKSLEAIEAGAVDVMHKPSSSSNLTEMSIQLIDKIKAAAQVKVNRIDPAKVTQKVIKPVETNLVSKKIIVIGASTGGTQAIQNFLQSMPENCPPIAIVQHMPEHFTRAFANRLNSICKISVTEAEDQDEMKSGKAIIAPGNYHMLIKKHIQGFCVQVKSGPLVQRHKPSVDVLFKSAAINAGSRSVGVIMTGMGRDGAEGMLEMKRKGAITIAQDEASCVVYGMPREAVALGAVDHLIPLDKIPYYALKNS